jgi:hypothetical protein
MRHRDPSFDGSLEKRHTLRYLERFTVTELYERHGKINAFSIEKKPNLHIELEANCKPISATTAPDTDTQWH